MKNRPLIRTWILALPFMATMTTVSTVQAEAPIMATGEAMSWQCAPCHGTNGQEFHEAMPPLAGMDEQQFVKAMLAYREGTRAAIIMDRVARGFTDEEIHAMAKWFAQQPVKPWDQTTLDESMQAQQAAMTGGQQ